MSAQATHGDPGTFTHNICEFPFMLCERRNKTMKLPKVTKNHRYIFLPKPVFSFF
jgi:hypothetical protein